MAMKFGEFMRYTRMVLRVRARDGEQFEHAMNRNTATSGQYQIAGRNGNLIGTVAFTGNFTGMFHDTNRGECDGTTQRLVYLRQQWRRHAAGCRQHRRLAVRKPRAGVVNRVTIRCANMLQQHAGLRRGAAGLGFAQAAFEESVPSTVTARGLATADEQHLARARERHVQQVGLFTLCRLLLLCAQAATYLVKRVASWTELEVHWPRLGRRPVNQGARAAVAIAGVARAVGPKHDRGLQAFGGVYRQDAHALPVIVSGFIRRFLVVL